ncbi:hypothetical protein AX16_006786 [Volvariella volvacea WC 439]|nr:hypothetical protein AX16_006786 [Volvariella volvacea WC 439]
MILSDDDGSETSSQTDPELPDSYDIDSDNAWPEALEALITDIKTVKPIHILLVLSIFILFTICVVLDISEYQNTQNSWVRDRIRTNWNNEQSSHIAFVRQYNVDKAAFQKDLYHHKEITSERAAEEKTRSQISDSRSQQEKEWEKKWKERKAIEGGWLEWERQMKEEKSSLRWSYPQAANANGRGKQCLGYGIREYTATLMHVPKGVSEKDILANCSRLPIEIHGVELSKPDFCDIVKSGWSNREYVGHWNLYSEPGCMTFWEKFEAKVPTPVYTYVHDFCH